MLARPLRARQASAYGLTAIRNARIVARVSLRICANIGPVAGERRRERGSRGDAHDRRTDVYDEMLGADVKRGWY